ncbi:MAG: hypothetical protein KGH64_04810 [Candidatus Micrarchaeota archaeon]|nr:hypothetical protein [Candidatus Micrarchaeota archaeon]MDE1834633.1 hypothetical protein [Candidatus Micrarchaeota archaeon]MDE1860016.1 hypothetical protein [Candidatus Micrarchaeota archaeon]
MAFAIARTQTQVREIKVTGGSVALIDAEANHAQSIEILSKHGMRPPTYQEAFVHLMQNPGLKEQLKGKWFYLAGEGLQANGYHTIDNTGNLKAGRGNPEETVYAYPGSRPLSLMVDSDTIVYLRRFFLKGVDWPGSIAQVVVGVKLDGSSQAHAGVLEAAQASKQLQKAVSAVVRSTGPAEEVVSRIAQSGLMNKGDVKKLQALVRDATKLGQTS